MFKNSSLLKLVQHIPLGGENRFPFSSLPVSRDGVNELQLRLESDQWNFVGFTCSYWL